MKKLFISILIGVSVLTSGCSKTKQEKQTTQPPETNQALPNKSPDNTNVSPDTNPQLPTQSKDDEANKASKSQEKTFTLEELKKYDGKSGNPSYVAVDGKVYDVTNNNKWKNGNHEGVSAGQDISKFIGSSPHGKSILKEVPVVGVLK